MYSILDKLMAIYSGPLKEARNLFFGHINFKSNFSQTKGKVLASIIDLVIIHINQSSIEHSHGFQYLSNKCSQKFTKSLNTPANSWLITSAQ